MLRSFMCMCVAVGCLGLTGAVASGQEVVHAMTGTVRSIDTVRKTFTLLPDNTSQITFNDMTNSKVRLANDQKLISDATAASAFDKTGAYVIVFYYGLIDSPTAIAIEALGQGPFTSTVGTVSDVNEGPRMLSVKDESGSIRSYKINAATVAESGSGVVDGIKFHAEKGDHVQVVGVATNNGPIALFVNEM